MSNSWTFFGALLTLLAACAGPGGQATTSARPATTVPETTTSLVASTEVEATTTTLNVEAMQMVVYYLLDEVGPNGAGPYLVPVYREAPFTEGVARASMDVLLAGPTPEKKVGIPAVSSAIPEGTRLLGITIEDGLATVDLSGEYDDGGGSFSMIARLAQVVYTLTRFPTVEEVAFSLDGEPVEVFSSEGLGLDRPQGRDDYLDLVPAIFVDTPAWGEPVGSPVRVAGKANVFEATFRLTLTDDDGLPLFEEVVNASCGTGCWGDFEVTVPYAIDRDQFGALIVWEASPKDGSPQNIREYPVRLGSGVGDG